MTKIELTESLAAKYSGLLASTDLNLVVDLILDEMTEALAEDRGVEIRGFGSLRLRHREPQTGRNPKTGETVQLGNRRIPYFTPGREFRLEIANSTAPIKAADD